MDESPAQALDEYRRDAGLTHGELWLRYFELGGMSSALVLEAFVYGVIQPSAHDRDVIAHALNERFAELGRNRSVPYSDDIDKEISEHPADALQPGSLTRPAPTGLT
jgi:hypothetical protein